MVEAVVVILLRLTQAEQVEQAEHQVEAEVVQGTVELVLLMEE
jgi:hypothetical protein